MPHNYVFLLREVLYGVIIPWITNTGGDMPVHELTEEEREKMIDQYFEMIGVERKHPGREELEKEIVDYLGMKHPCSLATCGKDGIPRISVVDYVNDGVVLYIISEGGEKFRNLRENNHVAVGIGTSARTTRSVRGVNIWGRGDVFTDETVEFAHAVKLFEPIIRDMSKNRDDPIEMPKNLLRVIRVTPAKMNYHHNSKGIKNACWEAE
ncbi:pyridoxamine 5'-phosphate oxidase family protein [Spirochaetota bacterium]